MLCTHKKITVIVRKCRPFQECVAHFDKQEVKLISSKQRGTTILVYHLFTKWPLSAMQWARFLFVCDYLRMQSPLVCLSLTWLAHIFQWNWAPEEFTQKSLIDLAVGFYSCQLSEYVSKMFEGSPAALLGYTDWKCILFEYFFVWIIWCLYGVWNFLQWLSCGQCIIKGKSGLPAINFIILTYTNTTSCTYLWGT